ncbi:hypothetical protein LV779_35220 [Streptomyces thinghirensis]|nr:hypothetical protein [Streptomyces thinghirensis]
MLGARNEETAMAPPVARSPAFLHLRAPADRCRPRGGGEDQVQPGDLMAIVPCSPLLCQKRPAWNRSWPKKADCAERGMPLGDPRLGQWSSPKGRWISSFKPPRCRQRQSLDKPEVRDATAWKPPRPSRAYPACWPLARPAPLP